MASVLPPEIIGQIIGNIHDDPTALRACSLTCKAWVVFSQGHIFHTVRLFFDGTWLKAFVQFLENCPHLTPYIRVLGMKGKWEMLAEAEYRFVEETIPLFAPKLVRIEELEVSQIRFHCMDASTQVAAIQAFPPLRRLSMTSSAFEDFHGLASFIISQPYLENLELNGCSWKSGVGQVAVFPAAGPPRHLRGLWVKNNPANQLIDWILSLYPLPLLHTIAFPDLCDITALSRLLDGLGPSLEHLQLCSPSLTEDVPTPPSISKNTSLRSLGIDDLIIYNVHDRTGFAWMLSFLSHANSTNLEEITLKVRYSAIEDIEAFEWERVDEVLSRENVNGLCRVVFWLVGAKDDTEARREIKRRMRGVCERGLLVFK